MLLEHSDVYGDAVKLGEGGVLSRLEPRVRRTHAQAQRVSVQLRLELGIVWQWRGQIVVVLGVTEGRQEVTFAAGCCILLCIGIPQHTNISRLQLGAAYYCRLVTHSTDINNFLF